MVVGNISLLFASLVSGLGEYLYCTFVEPDFIPSQIEDILLKLEAAPLDSPDMQALVELLRKGYEQRLYPTPIELVYQMIWLKLFLGSIVSLFVALFINLYIRFRNR